jgi:hypothetical protein
MESKDNGPGSSALFAAAREFPPEVIATRTPNVNVLSLSLQWNLVLPRTLYLRSSRTRRREQEET